MGRERLDEILKVAGLETLQKLPPNNLDKKLPFEWVSGLQEATEKVFGERTGRGINARVGRLCFNSVEQVRLFQLYPFGYFRIGAHEWIALTHQSCNQPHNS